MWAGLEIVLTLLHTLLSPPPTQAVFAYEALPAQCVSAGQEAGACVGCEEGGGVMLVT